MSCSSAVRRTSRRSATPEPGGHGVGQPGDRAGVRRQCLVVRLGQRQEQLANAVGEDEAAAPLVIEPLLGERERRAAGRLGRDHGHAEGALERLRVLERQPVERSPDRSDERGRITVEQEREGVPAEAKGARDAARPRLEGGEDRVAGVVPVPGVVGAEAVDVGDEQKAGIVRSRTQFAQELCPRSGPRFGRPTPGSSNDGGCIPHALFIGVVGRGQNPRDQALPYEGARGAARLYSRAWTSPTTGIGFRSSRTRRT
jgi:hypothetical protein